MKNKISRNALCPCGSGRKYKKCCLINSDMNIAQILKEVQSQVGEKVNFSHVSHSFNIDEWNDAGLLEYLGDGLYRVK